MRPSIPLAGHNRNRPGAAAVEFAIVAPLLLIFIFGIVEFGRIFMVLEQLNAAGRIGARTLSLPGKYLADATSAIDKSASGARITTNGNLVGITIAMDPSGGSNYTQVYNQTAGGTSRTAPTMSNSTFDSTYPSGSSIQVTITANLSDVTWLPFFANTSKVPVGTATGSLASLDQNNAQGQPTTLSSVITLRQKE